MQTTYLFYSKLGSDSYNREGNQVQGAESLDKVSKGPAKDRAWSKIVASKWGKEERQ